MALRIFSNINDKVIQMLACIMTSNGDFNQSLIIAVTWSIILVDHFPE